MGAAGERVTRGSVSSGEGGGSGGAPRQAHVTEQRAEQIRWARDVEPGPVEWLLEGYLARRIVTLIAGPRSTGKSLVAVWLAAEVNRNGDYVWINSLEDDLSSVVRPRCEVAGAEMEQTRLSAIPYNFPRDLNSFARDLRRQAESGQRTSLVILDSLQRHVPKYAVGEQASEAMEGLKVIAERQRLSILLVAHFVKNHGASVEQAIGGAGAVQNLAKAIFVVGPEPRTQERRLAAMLGEATLPTRVLACERLGVGPIPDSQLFELDTLRYEPTDRAEPFLEYVGSSEATALDVLRALRLEASGPDKDESKQTQAATWIVKTLAAGAPMPSQRLEDLAREAGVFFSANTFERARKLAEVEAIHPSRLEAALGEDAYQALESRERKLHWVRSGWKGAAMPEVATESDSTPPVTEDGGDMGEWGSASSRGGD